MSTISTTPVAFVAAAASIGCASAAMTAEMTIAEDGRSKAVVVVAPDATAPERYAASELAGFLKQVTGAGFKVVGDYSGDEHRLLVGPQAARLADRNFSTDGLGQEGIAIRTVGRDLILAGGRPRGTPYAVFTFLEDVVGCRWWTPTVSKIPRKPALTVPQLDVRYVPVLEYREPYWGGWVDADWAVRVKHNGGRTNLDARRGGKVADIGPCHSFDHYLSPKKYFNTHPTWFSEVAGERTGDRSQLCLTNKAMLQELTKNVKADVRAHRPDVSSVWVAQNDWHRYCECKACKAVNDREESLAGTVIQSANIIADAVAEEFPGVAVRIFAYDWSQKPPKHLKVSPNVIVVLCTTDCSYSQPYTHEQNQQFRERIRKWSKIADRIYIWDYLVNFANYICPHPNLRTLDTNVRFFVDHNVKGIFGQGAWGSATGTEFAELRRWVMCKLYWAPSLDSEKLIDEFLDGYYGPAGPHLRAYFDTFHDASDKSGAKLGMMEPPYSDNFLSFETVCKCLAHLRAAQAAVANDPDLATRVGIATLPILYVFLMRWDEYQATAKATGVEWPLDSKIKPVYEHFVSAMEKHDIKEVSEKNARGQWPSVKERVDSGPPLVPPGCEALPVTAWVDLQNAGFVTKPAPAGQPPWGVVAVKDDKASNGSAARFRTDHARPALYRQLWRVPLISAKPEGKKLHCRISVRCEVTGKDGVAFKCGIDKKNRDLIVKAADVPDREYHTYDLGVFDSLRGWIHLWIGPANNPDNVKTVWVDRAWLVVED